MLLVADDSVVSVCFEDAVVVDFLREVVVLCALELSVSKI